MTQKFKVLVTRKWPKKVEESLVATFDTKLNVEDKPLSESELIEAMKSYDALLPTVTDPITDKIISTLDRRVKIIGNFGVGFNNIDICLRRIFLYITQEHAFLHRSICYNICIFINLYFFKKRYDCSTCYSFYCWIFIT